MTTLIDTRAPSLAITEVMQLDGALDYGANVGTIRNFAGNYVPLGTVAADGSVLAVGGGSNLATLLSSSWGGDGTTTFGTPDADGRTLIGQGWGPGLPIATYGQAYGAAEVALTQANLPASLGGTSQPLDDQQPSLATRYFINMAGLYPPFDGTGDAQLGYIGMVTAWAGGSSPPSDTGIWAECAGQALSIAQYSALFSILGTMYGGDGQTNFRLPDLRGRTIVGVGGSVVQGQVDGSGDVTLTNTQVPTAMGGGGQPFYNIEPRLGMNYLIAVHGTVPSTSVNSVAVDVAMVGEIEAFAGNFAPEGWMTCQGQLLAIASYTDLFAQIGTTYGGDGVTTFALPDLRGRDLIGAGNGIAVGTTLGSDGVTLTLNQIPSITHIGSTGDDIIFGGNSADTLGGGDGNDTITAWGGADTLNGDAGNDNLSGRTGNDTIFGGAGADRLDGGAGNDRLDGGAGGDRLSGGLGADRFVFDRPVFGNDRIVDWSSADHDKLVIDASAFGGGLIGGVSVDASHLVQGTAATAATGQFLYDAGTGQLWWDSDGTGSHAAVKIAILSMSGGLHPASLALTDFQIIA